MNELTVDQMFEELSNGQALHPDQAQDEEHEDTQWVTADNLAPIGFDLTNVIILYC